MKTSCWFMLCLSLVFIENCHRPIAELYPQNKADRTISVYIISIGWHTTIAMDFGGFEKHLPDHPQMPQAQMLMFGWGDGEYYPHPDPGIWLLLRAALLPTDSVLHVAGIDLPVEYHFPSSRIVEIRISKTGAKELAKFIANQFQLDEEGVPVFASEGLYPNSAFFAAKPYYFFPRTSNRWVAQALRRTGYPVTPFYALTAHNVIKQAEKYGEVIR